MSIKQITIGRWSEIYSRLGIEIPLNKKHGACPVCGGNDRFRCDDKDGRGTWVCSQCEPINGSDTAAGDGFELVRRVFGYAEIKQAFKAVEDVLGIDSKPPSKEEREAYTKRLETQRAEAEAKGVQAHKMAAKAALAHWESSSPASDNHAYLKAKGVQPFGIRQQADDLIIPVHINGEITSIQRIKPDGTKLFQKGGEITGGYYSIHGRDDSIYITEGFATGATIQESTGAIVVVAFNAGNLKPVAEAIRVKYPDAKIIIAGDNDESKTGEKKGSSAANVVGGKFIMPNFADGESGTDWNDYAAAHGLDAVRDAFQKVEPAKVAKDTLAKKVDIPYPKGYSCNPSGVSIETPDKEPEPITHKPVWVSALSRDGACENWGRYVQWIDSDGHAHDRAVPAQMFHANGNELAQELAATGLPIIPGKERKLLQYLAAFSPDTRLTAATATGWHGDAFVMPDKTINEPENERIIYQSNEYRATSCMNESGTLEQWKDMIRNVSPPVKFAIAAALSAPLRSPTETAAGGFHFFGRTSHGKTTLLQAACSVWGNAADPANAGGADVYIQRWNATRNGLEGMAASFNDLPLIIDEIGESDGREFGRIVYQLMSGTGKTRANRTGGLSQRRAWRITLLSSGELPVADFIDGARGGQLVRLVDIEARDLFTGRKDADAMKHGCAKYYGLAGIAFLQSGDLLEGWNDTQADKIGDAPTAEAGRVRDRFRLVAHAGELAIKRGLLPWNQGQVLDACKSVFAGWKSSGNGMSDAERGIENIRNFLLAFGDSRFEYESDHKRDPVDRAGSYNGGCYNFTPAAFKEACKGVLADTVKRALRDAGLLRIDATGRLNAWAGIGGGRVRCVCVKDTILSGLVKTGGTDGTGGTKPGGATPDNCTTNKKQVVQGGTDAPSGFNSVPPRTSGETQVVQSKTVAWQGFVPPVPSVPLENSNLEKNEVDDDRVRFSI